MWRNVPFLFLVVLSSPHAESGEVVVVVGGSRGGEGETDEVEVIKLGGEEEKGCTGPPPLPSKVKKSYLKSYTQPTTVVSKVEA